MEIVKDTPQEVGDKGPEVTSKPPLIKYDPKKKYRWEPTDVFAFTGLEMNALINATRAILNTPEAQRVMLAIRANEVAEEALKRAVEFGIVKEVVETPKPEKS